jgi:hypothetical protein
MNKIYNINNLNIDFNNLELEFPKLLDNKYYFTKIKHLGEELLIQSPKCFTKEGIIDNKDKKCCNLKYSLNYDNNEHKKLHDFFINFKETCKSLIFSKNELWFQKSLEKQYLDTMFVNYIKYNKNKTNFFVKVSLDNNFNNYDENQIECSIDDIDIDTSLIPLIKINGIIFNDTNFYLDLCCSQFMIFNNTENKCLIKLELPEVNEKINNTENINLEENNHKNLEENNDKNLEETNDKNLEEINDLEI